MAFVSHKKFDDCRNPKTKRKLEFDFYIPSQNLLIEYDGLQHFNSGCLVNGKHITTTKEFQDIKERDYIKTKYALSKRINLLRIKYTELPKINQILETVFKKSS